MGVTRRTVLTSAVAGSAFAALAAGELARARASSASPVGDVVGKITVGYQGWFACPGDGAPINAWWHWSNNWSQPPSPSNNVILAWPDMREYARGYQTAYQNLNGGGPATLFSSFDQQTIDTHFRWMQQHGCDTAALQRFNPNSSEGPTRDAMAVKVRSAAETFGCKFYIMYDVTGWASMQSEIKTDWTSKMSAHVGSGAYARQNGKPVVCIWGFGFNDNNHPWDANTCLDVVNWFKGQGCYVIGGVPREWRTGVGGSRAGFSDVYHAFHMLSPWMVGAISTAADSDWMYQNINLPDVADCTAHGDFMWRQFYNMVRVGAQGIYISMFDEYGEGNQIAKTAETQAMVPAGSGLLALDEDGTACSSDYYLRLTADGGRMLKGQIPLTSTRPTQPVIPASSVVSLRSHANGRYVCAESAGTQPLIANRTAIGSWEQFDLIDLSGGNVALRSHANGRYVCAENWGTQPLIANRTAIGLWETFQLIRNPDGSVSLKALVNNNYVCAENAGTSWLVANRTAIGSWEQFDLITG